MKAITSEGEGEVELFLALELLHRILETDEMLGLLHALACLGDALAEGERLFPFVLCRLKHDLICVPDDVGLAWL